MEKSVHGEVWGGQKTYTWFNLNFNDQSSLFSDLPNIHCTLLWLLRKGMYLKVKRK